MNNITEKELILEFELRKPFSQLRDLITIANSILSEPDSSSMLDLREGKILGIHIFRCRRSFASLVLSAMIKAIPKSDVFAISKYNYAAIFHCPTKIELEDATKLDHGPNIRIILTLPPDQSTRERIERQFAILGS